MEKKAIMGKLETASQERDLYFNDLISFKMKIAQGLDQDMTLEQDNMFLKKNNNEQREELRMLQLALDDALA